MRTSSLVALGVLCGFSMAACNTDSDGGAGSEWTVDAGAVKLRISESPWKMTFFDGDGNPVLVELAAQDDGPQGSLGMHLGPPLPGSGQQAALPPLTDGMPSTPPLRDDGWVRATEVVSSSTEGATYTATLATTDPTRTLIVEAGPDPEVEGTIRIRVRPSDPDGVQVLGIGFAAESEERFVGFGERSNTVDQSG